MKGYFARKMLGAFLVLALVFCLSLSAAAVENPTKLSKAEEKEMSEFLDHFVEPMMGGAKIDRQAMSDEELIQFGIRDCYNYQPDKLKHGEDGMVSVAAKDVAEAVKKYFARDIKKHTTIDENTVYDAKKGTYTFMAADGGRPGVKITAAELIGGGAWTVEGMFVYIDDSEEEFEASFATHKYKGRDTYFLMSMEMK